jgi:hypothetical protein
MDMGGSAQNTLLTALHHDSQHYNVWLIKGSTLESAMTKAETKLVEDQLSTYFTNKRLEVFGRAFSSYAQIRAPHSPHPHLKSRDSRSAGCLDGTGSYYHPHPSWARFLWSFRQVAF